MIKNRVNLIINRADYNKYQSYINYLKIILFSLSFISFIFLAITLINLQKQIKKSNELNLKKSNFIKLLTEKNNEEVKIKFLEKKYQLLNKYLNDDSFSSPYYQLLLENLSLASNEPKLKVFKINKNRDTEFIISFNDFKDLREFFKFTESEIFTKNFEKLSLKSFNINNELNQKEDYELSFIGKFIQIKKL